MPQHEKTSSVQSGTASSALKSEGATSSSAPDRKKGRKIQEKARRESGEKRVRGEESQGLHQLACNRQIKLVFVRIDVAPRMRKSC